MEKRTIGSFIAALRRAAGMTQRELADRLNVSDKTISRWERDDGYPDLTLIPVIAEIFGVTSDELLRGQRNPAKRGTEEDQQEGVSKKGTRELKMLINQAISTFRNHSIIAVGVAVIGLIVTAVFNTGFNRGLVGFFLGCLFMVAGIVIQTVSMNSMLTKDYRDIDDGRIRNTTIRTSELVFSAIAVLFMFMLPIVILLNDNFVGLTSRSWVEQGLPLALAALVVCLIVIHFLNGHLVKKGALVLNETEKARHMGLYRLRTRCGAVLAAVLLVTFTIQSIIANTSIPTSYMKGTRFDDLDSFVAYMEQDIPEPWNSPSNGMDMGDTTYYDEYGNEISRDQFMTQTITDDNGNELTFVHRNREVVSFSFDSRNGSISPITAFTYEDYRLGELEVQRRGRVFMFIYILEVLALVFTYYILKRRVD